MSNDSSSSTAALPLDFASFWLMYAAGLLAGMFLVFPAASWLSGWVTQPLSGTAADGVDGAIWLLVQGRITLIFSLGVLLTGLALARGRTRISHFGVGLTAGPFMLLLTSFGAGMFP